MTMRIKLSLLIGTLAVLCSVSSVVYAAPSYTVAPLVIDLDVEPRDLITREITITNTGPQPVTVYPTVNNILVDEGGTITSFVQRVHSDATASLAAWIEINRGGLRVPVGESVTRTITFRIHPLPKEGIYHAFIGFGHGRNVDDANKMVNEGRAPGVVATVSYKKESTQLLKLSRFFVDRFVTKADNESVTYTVDNPGDEPLAPSGEIIFYNNRGIEVASVPVNPEAEIIEPGGERQFSVAAPTDGLLGKYKAYLSVDYGSSQLASVQDTTFFYVFPLKTIFILLGAVLIVAAFAAVYVHRRYLDDDEDDESEQLFVHVRDTTSEAKDHDIDLKKK